MRESHKRANRLPARMRRTLAIAGWVLGAAAFVAWTAASANPLNLLAALGALACAAGVGLGSRAIVALGLAAIAFEELAGWIPSLSSPNYGKMISAFSAIGFTLAAFSALLAWARPATETELLPALRIGVAMQAFGSVLWLVIEGGNAWFLGNALSLVGFGLVAAMHSPPEELRVRVPVQAPPAASPPPSAPSIEQREAR